jgi:hypothetical protein
MAAGPDISLFPVFPKSRKAIRKIEPQPIAPLEGNAA